MIHNIITTPSFPRLTRGKYEILISKSETIQKNYYREGPGVVWNILNLKIRACFEFRASYFEFELVTISVH